MTYFKSFAKTGPEHEITTYDATQGKRFRSQTLSGVLAEQTIRPNTTHTYLPARLCASKLSPSYLGSYRPEGIIFDTDHKPILSTPFDLMAITTGNTFTSQDYNATFLEGCEEFVFENIEDMFAAYPSAHNALERLNTFRAQHGLPAVNTETMQYNECCFFEDVPIKPVALVGTSEDIIALAKAYNLPLYASITEYHHAQ